MRLDYYIGHHSAVLSSVVWNFQSYWQTNRDATKHLKKKNLKWVGERGVVNGGRVMYQSDLHCPERDGQGCNNFLVTLSSETVFPL